MDELVVLAQALRYPIPGSAQSLESSLQGLASGPVKQALASYCEEVSQLSLGEWEELYTRTWDLNPVMPPYIGFQIWGEDYRRGKFLACLQRAYQETGMDTGGELADHLVPVLLYLAQAGQPVPELQEVFGPAVEKMAAVMRKRDPGNPYLHLLHAVAEEGRARGI